MLDAFILWFRDHIPLFRVIFLSVSAVMLGLIMYMNAKLGLTKEVVDHVIDVVGSKNISRRRQLLLWRRALHHLSEGSSDDLRLAVMDADRVLDEILKVSHFPGMTMEERLESITETDLSSIQEVLEVHKLRQRLSRDRSLTLTPEEAENAVNIYRRVFVDFGLLEE